MSLSMNLHDVEPLLRFGEPPARVLTKVDGKVQTAVVTLTATGNEPSDAELTFFLRSAGQASRLAAAFHDAALLLAGKKEEVTSGVGA